jgi:hypothetical protein
MGRIARGLAALPIHDMTIVVMGYANINVPSIGFSFVNPCLNLLGRFNAMPIGAARRFVNDGVSCH